MTLSDRHPVDVIAEAFVDQLRRGLSPDIEKIADANPEHADVIRRTLPSLRAVEKLNGHFDFDAADHADDHFTTVAMPAKLGDFRLVRQIGRGGMGVVYEAVQESLQRRVALKVIGPASVCSKQNRQRFRREAEAIAGLHHTNIVAVYGSGESDGLLYYAMHLVDGVTLARSDHRAPASIPIDWNDHRRIAQWITDIADALHYAHGQGVLHRDIKPANLMIDTDGHVWLTDFGLAVDRDSDRFTQTGEIVGTLRYMAPEQLRGQQDVRSDVFCLGVTLYELITGRPAIAGKSEELLSETNRRRIEAPRSIRGDLPGDLNTVVMKAIALDPAHRYQTAAEFRDDLLRFLNDRPITARPITMLEKSWRAARRNPVVAGLSAATFALLLTLTVVSIWTNHNRSVSLNKIAAAYVDVEQSLQERTRALGLADEARRAADAERTRAETNLTLALDAFQGIIDNVASRVGRSEALWETVGDDSDWDTTSGEVLSDADIALLDGLLQFFDRFASENSADLRLPSADARGHVGDIALRLGRFDEAEASYEIALELYQQLATSPVPSTDDIRRQVNVINGLMRVAAAQRQPVRLRHWLDVCRKTCHPHTDPEPQTAPHRQADVRYLWAKSLSLAGSLAPGTDSRDDLSPRRPGGGPRSYLTKVLPDGDRPGPGARMAAQMRWHHRCTNDAIDLLVQLTETHPDHPPYQLALASAYQVSSKQMRWTRDRSESFRHREAALDILERLSREHPDVDEFRYQWADTLATGIPMTRGSADQLQQAMTLVGELLRRSPDNVDYQSLKAGIRMRQGLAQYVFGNRDRGEAMLVEAVAMQKKIVRQHPDVPVLSMALAQSLWSIAELQSRESRGDEASRSLEEAIESIDKNSTRRLSRGQQTYLRMLRQRRASLSPEEINE